MANRREEVQLKSTGMARPVDSLGRVVLPKELRDVMDIKMDDSMEVFVDGNRIVLRKFMRNCIFCGDGSNVRFYRDMAVCRKCAEDLFKKVRA